MPVINAMCSAVSIVQFFHQRRVTGRDAVNHQSVAENLRPCKIASRKLQPVSAGLLACLTNWPKAVVLLGC